MFSALADQLHFNGLDFEVRSALQVRNQLVDFIWSNSPLLSRIASFLEHDETITSYLSRMNTEGNWGDGNILSAASLLFKTRIEVYTHGRSQPMVIASGETENQVSTTLALGFINEIPNCPETHYVSLRKTMVMKTATLEAPHEKNCKLPVYIIKLY